MKVTQHHTIQDIKMQVGRVPKQEAPTNRTERRARRASRKEEFAAVQEHRSGRMGNLEGKWQDHRKSFISEEEELDRLMKAHKTPWSCCGVALCCGW